MKKYFNIYYGSERINKFPLSENEVQEISNLGKPIQKLRGDKIVTIPLSKVRVVKCTIV